MKEFLFVFRRSVESNDPPQSPEQLQAMMKPWQDWMGSIAAQNKLSSSGNRLTNEGKVVKPNKVITDGPYVDIKEAIGGYIIVKANTLIEAAALADGCPILQVGGTVEVRMIVPMEDNN